MNAKQLRTALVAVLFAVLPVALGAQTAPNQETRKPPNQATTAPPQAPTQGAGEASAAVLQGHVLRILSPRTGERLTQDFVNVEFELINGGVSAAATPNFEVRLDEREPVTISSSSYTFTGLKPGPHTLTVQLVDANGTPVMGARSQTEFVVVEPGPGPGAALLLEHRPPSVILASLRVEEAGARAANRQRSLAAAAGALPLLSVIGFGVLLGGIATTLKTRSK